MILRPVVRMRHCTMNAPVRLCNLITSIQTLIRTSRKPTQKRSVQILLGNTDLREMRLRLVQNADGMDIDGDARTVLAKVADYEMKRICGRNADSIVMVYDRPSFDVMRPTPYFDYRVEAEGSTMREYGFRCVYNN